MSINRAKRVGGATYALGLVAVLSAICCLGGPAAAGPWNQNIKLLPTDGDAGDEFGYTVSISGATAIIGAWRDEENGFDSGSAYIFQDSGPGWSQVRKIMPGDAFASDYFGVSVSLSGDMAVVGASGDDDNSEANSGSAYIFYRDQGGAGNWGPVAKLHASDPDANDNFGRWVAVSGDTAIVGAPYDDDDGTGSGSAYIFQQDQGGPDNWGFVRKLTASDAAASDYFGLRVAISGDYAIVGAKGNDDGANHAGSAYIFYRHQGGMDLWGEVKKLVASDPGADDWFGNAVAISGEIALVGAFQDDQKAVDAGAAYIFQKDQGGANQWGEVIKLMASDGAADDEFGTAVSIRGDLALVGAPNDNYGGTTRGGSAYLFRANGGSWNEEAKVLPSDIAGGDYDRFGDAVSVDGGNAIIGRPSDDANGDKAGAVHVFSQYRLTMQVWPQGAGTTTPPEGVHSYGVGTVVNINATPISGYLWDQWTGPVDGPPGNASNTVTMDADKTVTANFASPPEPPRIEALELFYNGNYADAADPAKSFLAVGQASSIFLVGDDLHGNVTNCSQGITGIRVTFDTVVTFSAGASAAFSYEATPEQSSDKTFTPFVPPTSPVYVVDDSTGQTIVTITFTDGEIKNRWLKTIIDASQVSASGLDLDGEMTAPLTLPSGDGAAGGDAEFIIGNRFGDVDGNYRCLLNDAIAIRSRAGGALVGISNAYDVDKNQRVLLNDAILTRNAVSGIALPALP